MKRGSSSPLVALAHISVLCVATQALCQTPQGADHPLATTGVVMPAVFTRNVVVDLHAVKNPGAPRACRSRINFR